MDASCYTHSDHTESRKMFNHLLENGILILQPDMLHGAISYAHSESDISNLTSTIERYVKNNR
jgi:glutamate-1-semialdehyde aminotransferase